MEGTLTVALQFGRGLGGFSTGFARPFTYSPHCPLESEGREGQARETTKREKHEALLPVGGVLDKAANELGLVSANGKLPLPQQFLELSELQAREIYLLVATALRTALRLWTTNEARLPSPLIIA